MGKNRYCCVKDKNSAIKGVRFSKTGWKYNVDVKLRKRTTNAGACVKLSYCDVTKWY